LLATLWKPNHQVGSPLLNICIVEDDPLAAGLLRDYIEGDDMRVVCHYSSAEDAMSGIPNLPLPDVILMDVGLPGVSGIEATENLKSRFPDLEVIMLTTFEDTETIVRSIKAGASGYLLKASRAGDIRDAITQICRGGSTLSGSVARKLLQEFRHPTQGRDLGADRVASDDSLDSLTTRESHILDLLISGGSYKAIAADLDISVHTVNNHIRHIYKKLRVQSRSEAVAKSLGLTRAS
jgi:DNA-binding NarL/FixJ family response regulator